MATIFNYPRLVNLSCSAEEIQAIDAAFSNSLFSRLCDGSVLFLDLVGTDEEGLASIAATLSVSAAEITDAVLMLVEG